MKPIKRFQIGKKGLTEEFIEHLKNAFKDSNLVKVSILKSACRTKEDAEKIGKEIISALGKKFNYKLIGYVLTIRKFRKEIV